MSCLISLARTAERLNNGEGLLGTSSDNVVNVPASREARTLNEPLRRALLQARLREDDVAAHLGVDPKTVRRWLNGRIPYPANRAALADLVGADELDLWPDAGGPLTTRTRPAELIAIYPHRRSVPREVWTRLFSSAERDIGILAYSALFLAEDAGILRILADKGRTGVTVRIALCHPDSPHVVEHGAMPANIRNALTLYRPLQASKNIDIRLHRTILYNSIYLADDQLVVNQHAYGVPAAHSLALIILRTEGDGMYSGYLGSFEHVWSGATPLV